MISAHFLLLVLATLLWFVAALVEFTSRPHSAGIVYLGLFMYGLALMVR